MMPHHPIAEAAVTGLAESLQHAASVARACKSLEVVEYTMAQPARWYSPTRVAESIGQVERDVIWPYGCGLRGIGFREALERAIRPAYSPHDLALVVVADCDSMEPRDARQILSSMDAWQRAERLLRQQGASAPRGVIVLFVGKGPFQPSCPSRPEPFPSISRLARDRVRARASLPDFDLEAIRDRLLGEGGALRVLQATVSKQCRGRQLLLTDRAIESIVQATQVAPWGRDSAMQVVADLARNVLPVAEFVAAKTEFDIQIEVSDSDQSLRVGPKIPSHGDCA